MSKNMRKGQHQEFTHIPGVETLFRPSTTEEGRKTLDRIFPNSRPYWDREDEVQKEEVK